MRKVHHPSNQPFVTSLGAVATHPYLSQCNTSTLHLCSQQQQQLQLQPGRMFLVFSPRVNFPKRAAAVSAEICSIFRHNARPVVCSSELGGPDHCRDFGSEIISKPTLVRSRKLQYKIDAIYANSELNEVFFSSKLSKVLPEICLAFLWKVIFINPVLIQSQFGTSVSFIPYKKITDTRVNK